MAASDYLMAARSSADGPRSLIHVVDKEGEFCSTAGGITSFLDVHGLLDRGTDYTVVGIMGAQSSGKSMFDRTVGRSSVFPPFLLVRSRYSPEHTVRDLF